MILERRLIRASQVLSPLGLKKFREAHHEWTIYRREECLILSFSLPSLFIITHISPSGPCKQFSVTTVIKTLWGDVWRNPWELLETRSPSLHAVQSPHKCQGDLKLSHFLSQWYEAICIRENRHFGVLPAHFKKHICIQEHKQNPANYFYLHNVLPIYLYA